MRETHENKNETRVKPRSAPRLLTAMAAFLAVMQACLTIEGRGVVGFILWIIIFFVAYWLFFTIVLWIWRRLRDRG